MSGNVWIANTRNNVIDEFDPNGNGPLREVPTGGRTNTVLNWRMDVAFSPTGTMYIADTVGSDIQAYSVPATGAPTLLWRVGNRGTGTGQFNNPYSVVYNSTMNRLLVTNSFNSRIVSLNPATGASSGVLPISIGAAAGDISGPKGIAVDASGNIWIADTRNNRIEEFTSAGAFTADHGELRTDRRLLVQCPTGPRVWGHGAAVCRRCREQSDPGLHARGIDETLQEGARRDAIPPAPPPGDAFAAKRQGWYDALSGSGSAGK